MTRLGQYADKAIEIGWLAAAIFAPLYFNVYSSRVFEPDKISTVRTIVLLMLVAWIIKLGEAGWRGWRDAANTGTIPPPQAARGGGGSKAGSAATRVVDTATPSWLPSWLGFMRVPMIFAILLFALAYLISSLFTVTPEATWLGSYQRLQGTYSQYSYMLLGILVLFNLRTRAQLNRLVTFMLFTSLPVALYGIVQAMHLDPLPWAGDTATRVASSMGNAIFVAAWLIMVVPFTIYRLITGISGAITARNAATDYVEPEYDGPRGRGMRRPRYAEMPSYGWAVIANSAGVILSSLMFFYMILKMMAGLPYPDGRTWWFLPFALVVFALAVWFIEWLSNRHDDPAQASLIMPIVGALVFFTAFLALPVKWGLQEQTTALQLDFEGGGLLWAIFFFLLWASLAAGLYALSARERDEGYADPDRGIVRASLNVAYVLLLLVQLICIYLTQSRGPWLGLGTGLVTFMVALWLIGRSRDVSWMRRIGGVASALVLIFALFVGALNIPGSPLTGLSNLPVVGRGIERLSTLTRTEDGTGKVRRLIWQGATQLIVSDPARSIIGWGPEAMYVAYNRFYPAELSQVELRNATPDRSHNVEFDQLVTLGALGLIMYYFVVGSFFFYGLRLVKRARSTLDQLFGVTLLAAIASHFIEIQTGIQIASTWTYFYLIIGMMVAFGYYMTNYLRPDEEVAAVAAAHTANAGARSESAAMSEEIAAEARPVAIAAGARQGGRPSSTMQATGNGKPQASGQAARRGQGGSQTPGSAQARGSQGQGSRGAPAPDARRPRATVQYNPNRGGGYSGDWLRSPIMLALYGIVALAALVFIFTVNAATVKADTLFKQAQAYDAAGRFFLEKDQQGIEYPGSITFYDEALSLQPNQDYYYLFVGRAYLEASKAVDQEPYNRRIGVAWSENEETALQQKSAERLARLQESERRLKTANALSPYNTDHYANLGRLYLYWGDPSGANDPAKRPLAVQWMEDATEHTPQNSQLWVELAVAYSRNGQFTDAVAALQHARGLDALYPRPPFVRGQLYQERAATIQNLLMAGQPLPTDGEVDFGKLVLEAGRAFSETIETDPTQMVDGSYQSRIDFFVRSAQPFTNTNSSLTQAQLTNVLTDTVIQGFKNDIARHEADLANRVRNRGVAVAAERVDDATLQNLWANPAWARVNADGTGDWLADEVKLPATRAAVDYYGLGLIYATLGDKTTALAQYNRALALRPTYNEVLTALQALQQTTP